MESAAPPPAIHVLQFRLDLTIQLLCMSVSTHDKRFLANLTRTIISNGRIPTTYKDKHLLLYSPDDCMLYPNGSVIFPSNCAWDPRDGCERGSQCYADSYTRDSTYGITFAPEFYLKDGVRSAAEIFLNVSVPWGPHSEPYNVTQLGLKVVEAILPLGSLPGGRGEQLSFGCPDNNAFMLKLAAFYATQWDDPEWLCEHEPTIAAVYTWARRLRGPEGLSTGQYGFMDCVGVSGNNLFMSLLFVEGSRAMAAALTRANCSAELTVPISNYSAEAEYTANAIDLLFDESVGMYRATDQHDNETDIWGSVFSVSLGAGSAAHRQAVIDYVTANHEIIFAWGQVRHLPYPQSWQYAATWNRTGNNNLPGNFRKHRCHNSCRQTECCLFSLHHSELSSVQNGHSEPGCVGAENGGYWALPVSWALQTVAKKDPALATKLLQDCLQDFRANGIWEWVNWAVPVPGNRVGHPNYVASAAAVYSFVRDFATETL